MTVPVLCQPILFLDNVKYQSWPAKTTKTSTEITQAFDCDCVCEA